MCPAIAVNSNPLMILAKIVGKNARTILLIPSTCFISMLVGEILSRCGFKQDVVMIGTLDILR